MISRHEPQYKADEHLFRQQIRSLSLLAGVVTAIGTQAAGVMTELHIAPQEISEPKYFVQENDGQVIVTGLCVDIMHAIARIDPQIRFVFGQHPQSLARIEAGLVTGQLQAACGLLRTSKRERVLRYIEPPLRSTDFYMAVRADDDVKVQNWDDVRRLGDDGIVLGKYDCALVLRDVHGLKTDFSAKDPKTNIQKLLAGRGRFFLHRLPGIEHAIRDAGAQGKVKILPAVMSHEPIYMVLSKEVPAQAAARIQTAISQLEASGELDRLFVKWNAY